MTIRKRAQSLRAPLSRSRRGPAFAVREVAGGLGDAGLLIPLAVAMITLNGLNATAAFGLVGVAYIGTAAYFRVPVSVQPLKAFAAAAIALGLSAGTIAAGALLMSAAMAALAVTGGAGWLAARFPTVLVRGIQASVALLLGKAALELAERGNWEGLAPIAPAASIAIAIAACLLLFATRGTPVPGSLVVLGGGVAIGLAVSGAPPGLGLGPEPLALAVPPGDAFATALTALVIAQLPLTFGNSVVATADAERTYYGERASRVKPGRLAGSISIWNLGAGLAGGLPVCHGAGGVTAHYSLGARTAFATASAGALFLVLALVLGGSLPALLRVIAPGALAGMLLFVAIQHGVLAARLERLDDRLIAAAVGIITLAAGSLAIGFAAGVVAVAGRHLWAGRRRTLGARVGSRRKRTT